MKKKRKELKRKERKRKGDGQDVERDGISLGGVGKKNEIPKNTENK